MNQLLSREFTDGETWQNVFWTLHGNQPYFREMQQFLAAQYAKGITRYLKL
jgi:hypothetical protein